MKQDERDKHNKHIILMSAVNQLINQGTQNGTRPPLNSHSMSPVPLLGHHDLPWIMIRIREIQNSNRATTVLYCSYLFKCGFPLLDSKLPDTAATPSF